MENTHPKLFSQTQFDQLIQNGSDTSADKDYPPVVKLFLTNTSCMWLISELDPEYPDIAFGLCDLGIGFPELGSVSLQEIIEAQCFFNRLKADTAFKSNYPLSVYARAARRATGITTDESALNTVSLQPNL